MERQEPPKASSTGAVKPGVPLYAVLLVLVAIAVAVGAAGTVWFLMRSDSARLKRQLQSLSNEQTRAEIERKRGAESDRLVTARNRQSDFLAQARNATNLLGGLLRATEQVNREAATLKSGDGGRRVAVHPELVVRARRLYESELPAVPTVGEITAKLESVRRIDQELIASLGTAHEPEAEVGMTAQNTALWAESEGRRVAQVQAVVSALVQEAIAKAPGNPVTSDSATLETAVERLVQAESVVRQRVILEKTSDAKAQGLDTVATAEAEKILSQAKVEAARILQAAREEAKGFEREKQVKDAAQTSKDVDTQLAVKQVLSEADKKILREEAARPDVKTLLAPFTTPGYWTTKTKNAIYKGSLEKRPLSFTELKSSGALEATFDGSQKLVNFATDRDNDRPHWEGVRRSGGSLTAWRSDPEKVKYVENAQKILNRLGPTLVELGLLQP